MTRTFFDITDIVHYVRLHSSISGIQRAAAMIVAEVAARAQADHPVMLSFVDPNGGGHVCVPVESLLAPLTRFDTDQLRQAFGIRAKHDASKPFAAYLERYTSNPLKYGFHSLRLRLAVWQRDTRYLQRRGIDLEALGSDTAHQTTGQRVSTIPFRDVAEPGDRLCLLGASWGKPKLDKACQEANARGVQVIVMVHDLIPMKFPDMVEMNTTRFYYDWLSATLAYCAGYMANSRSTAADLRAFLGELGCDLPVSVTPLAQAPLAGPAQSITLARNAPAAHVAVLQRARDADALSSAVREACLTPFALCVGTVEPRKNLWRVARAWQLLAQEPDLDLPRLVLAGKKGWLSDCFLLLLADIGCFGCLCVHLVRPSEAALDYLYLLCQFSVTASLYEGWGLPIGEGLSYGKTGIVSKTSSMPEVGGDLVEYCDPTAMSDIARACRRLISDPAHRRALEARIAAATLRNWQDVGADVAAVLADHTVSSSVSGTN